MTKPIILPYKGIYPKISKDAWIAPGAVIIGDVSIGAESSVWFGCVIRGDVNSVHIGRRTNIQDGTVIHVTRKTGPTKIGSGITVGHGVILHACMLEDDCFIGMGATIMDFVNVESGAMIAAGALVNPKKSIPSGQIYGGTPAKFLRDMREEEKDFIAISAQNYVELSAEYNRSL